MMQDRVGCLIVVALAASMLPQCARARPVGFGRNG
jgi:hypothetical protein